MGQKVNPISMRLQVNKNWKSRWYAEKREYRDNVLTDIKVRQLIETKIGRRGSINAVEIERSPSLVTVKIFTAKAGVIIGKGGIGVQELKSEIEKILKSPVRIDVEEIKKSEMYAKLVAENIAGQLERRIPFRRALKSTAAASMRAGAKGIKIVVAGRLNNAEMARTEKIVEGSVPLHTIRADIDYALTTAQTGAGTIGVKVWIYKGDKFGN